MINIVIYGKPRAFESHEYAFDAGKAASVDNSFPEPILKPTNFQEPVLHYFSREGYAGIECYNRAKGFESERDGIVFGIALKTDHDFVITKVFDNVLMRFWPDFAGALLNAEDRFICPSMLEALNGTSWGDEDISIIQQSLEQGTIQIPNKKICLLYAPEYEKISIVESQLKDYSDVYISGNHEIFKNPINKVVLNLTGGKIHTIKDSAIVEVQKESTSTTSQSRRKPYNWGGSVKHGLERTGNRYGSYQSDSGESDELEYSSQRKSQINKLTKIITVSLVAILVIGFVLFKVFSPTKESPGNNGNNSTGGTVVPEYPSLPNEYPDIKVRFNPYSDPIKESLPYIFVLNNSYNSPVVYSDITLSVDRPDIVELKKNENDRYCLVVKNRPTIETTIKITAKYENQIVGEKTYKIAKKEDNKPVTKGTTGTNSYKDVIIVFDKRQSGSVFMLSEKIQLTAKEKDGNIVKGGTWSYSDDAVKINTNRTANPTTVWAVRPGTYTIKYTYNNAGKKQEASTTIKYSY